MESGPVLKSVDLSHLNIVSVWFEEANGMVELFTSKARSELLHSEICCFCWDIDIIKILYFLVQLHHFIWP
jgi:hypothetical protein